jgi:hypothetical protein
MRTLSLLLDETLTLVQNGSLSTSTLSALAFSDADFLSGVQQVAKGLLKNTQKCGPYLPHHFPVRTTMLPMPRTLPTFPIFAMQSSLRDPCQGRANQKGTTWTYVNLLILPYLVFER